MVEIEVNIADLKGEGSDLINELAEFLGEKTEVEVETRTDEIVVIGEGKTVSKKYLRVILRRFLHQTDLKDFFRVISGGESGLIVKERKIQEV